MLTNIWRKHTNIWRMHSNVDVCWRITVLSGMVWVFLAFKTWWYGYSLRSKRDGMDIPCILMNKNDLPYRRDRDSLDFLYPRASQTCPRAYGPRAGLAGPRVKKIQAVPLSSIRYIPFSFEVFGIPDHSKDPEGEMRTRISFPNIYYICSTKL